MTYKVHEVADAFPMMTNAEFEALKEDIKQNGQREPIVFWKGMLVDGRNRLKACEELGIKPQRKDLADETDPVAWVISHNLHRRHLTESQRAMVAAKLADMKSGERTDLVSNDTRLSIDDAAKQLKVGRASVARAKKVTAEGSAEVQKAVESGEIPVSVAAELVKEIPDKAEQTKIVEGGAPEIRRVLKKPNKARKAEKDSTPEKTIDQTETPKEKSCDNCKKLEKKCKDFERRLNKEFRNHHDEITELRDENKKLVNKVGKLLEELSKLRSFHHEEEKPQGAPKRKPEHWIEPGEVVAEVKDSEASQ